MYFLGRMGSSLAVALAFASIISCQHSPNSDTVGGSQSHGGMVAVYPNVELLEFQRTNEVTALAAAVVGLSTVEVLEFKSSRWRSREVCPPSSDTSPSATGCDTSNCSPISLALADVNFDAHEDLLVVDPACGSWIALDVLEQSSVSVPWEQVLPAVVPSYTLLAYDINSDGQDEVIAANPERVSVCSYDNGWLSSTGLIPDFPQMDHMRATRLVLSLESMLLGQSLLAMQRGPLMQVFPMTWGEHQLLGEPEIWEQENLEHEKPYSGFDHLAEVSFEGCDAFALGVGLFHPIAGDVPRELQLLRQTVGGYSATTLPTANEVQHFSVLPSEKKESYFVVVFGAAENGEKKLSLCELGPCFAWECHGVFDIEFDWRTIDNPEYFADPRYPKTLGVKLVASLSEDEKSIDLRHYDGFSLRAYRLELEAGSWSVQSFEQVIHQVRNDLVFKEMTP